MFKRNPAAHLCPLHPATAALNFSGFRALNVVSWNPLRIVCLGHGGRFWGLVARISGSLLTEGFLGAILGLSGLALLGEVGRNPKGVEEIAGSNEGGKDKEVKENPENEVSVYNKRYNTFRLATNTWGSNMLIGGSTTDTVPL